MRMTVAESHEVWPPLAAGRSKETLCPRNILRDQCRQPVDFIPIRVTWHLWLSLHNGKRTPVWDRPPPLQSHVTAAPGNAGALATGDGTTKFGGRPLFAIPL